MSKSGIKTVFGGASVGQSFKTIEDCHAVFKLLKAHHVDTIDTAQLYGSSEQILGEANAGEQFTIDTKTPGGFFPDTNSKDLIIKNGHESPKKLRASIDIFYIHAPSKNEPNADVLSAVNQLHQAGVFKRFGLSNFVASHVQAVYDYCDKNAVARRQETELLPTLRKLGISFYAYSPIAGGFLTKSKEDVLAGKGRFGGRDMVSIIYKNMYARPQLLDALAQWGEIAEGAGIPRAELAYRWVKYNSALKPEHGDAVIVGASSLSQLEQTLDGLDHGPLPSDVVAKIDAIWDTIKHVAPLDNYTDGANAGL